MSPTFLQRHAIELIKALNLPAGTHSVDIHMEARVPITVTCRYYPTDAETGAMLPVLSTLELVEQEAGSAEHCFTRDDRVLQSLAAIESKLTHLTTETDKMSTELSQLQSDLAAEGVDVQAIAAAIPNLATALSTAQQQNAALQAQIATLLAAGGASVTDLQALDASATSQKATLDTALAAANAALSPPASSPPATGAATAPSAGS